MSSIVTNILKKKVKQWHDGYVKHKETKKNYKLKIKEELDETGAYRAEPSEDLYEQVPLLCETRENSDDNVITSNYEQCGKLSCSTNPSNDSQRLLLESSGDNIERAPTDISLDTGISRSSFKKQKKLQFSPDSDKIYVFEQNTLERGSYNPPCPKEKHIQTRLCKAKVFTVPTVEKVQIINQELRRTLENQPKKHDTDFENTFTRPLLDDCEKSSNNNFSRLKIKESHISPKIYSEKHNKVNFKNHSFRNKNDNSSTSCGLERNSSQRSCDHSALQTSNNTNSNKENYWDFDTYPTRKTFNGRHNFTRQFSTPPQSSAPKKPPRSAQNLKRIYTEPTFNTNSLYQHYDDDTKWRFYNNNLRHSLIDEDGYSVPFDMKEEHYQNLTNSSVTVNKDRKITEEPIYDQITPRSPRETKLTDSCHSFTNSKPGPIYTQITPRSSRNMDYYLSKSQLVFHPDANSTVECGILSQENKHSLNMIHNTNWSLNKDEVISEHKCLGKTKRPEEQYLEEKFVINMFESRPSKRWEKHMRDLDQYNMHKNENFDRNKWKRLSLDSKKQKNKSLETNVKIDQEIEMLEKECKDLESTSKRIKTELRRIELENNDTLSKVLEKQNLQIEEQPNKLNNNIDSTTIKLTDDSREIGIEIEQIKLQSTEEYNKYKSLKKSRDIQCARMTQASKALEEIKSRRGSKDWLEVLIAERVLLETSEKVKLLTQQIRDNTYSVIPEPPLHKSTVHLSEIKFPFLKEFQGNCKQEKHKTEFFVMTLSYGTQIFVSEFMTGESDPLVFSRSHAFESVTPDFEIKVKLFCLKMRTSNEYFWEKFTCCNFCPTSKIIYEDLLTSQFQEKTVFKTSFKLCAETTLTRIHINEVSVKLETKLEVFPKLEPQIGFSLKCEDANIVANLSGFLDVGQLHGEIYFWEKKWCVLDGQNLRIYNYPQDVDFGRPIEQVNLEYCFGPIITKVDNCPKRRCFHLKTGRPNNMSQNSSSVRTLKTKPNFELRKFYFAATNMEQYLRWTTEVEKILNTLSDFKKLAFGEEYVEYLKQ